MRNWRYTTEIVLLSYYVHEGDRRPKPQKLDRWEQELFDFYDDSLEEILPEFDIPLTKPNKSLVVMLALSAAGTDPDLRVERACEYFKFTFPS